MRRKLTAVLAGTVLAFGGLTVATPAMADAPGPGNSGHHHCAPGQHGNPHPGFKPGNC